MMAEEDLGYRSHFYGCIMMPKAYVLIVSATSTLQEGLEGLIASTPEVEKLKRVQGAPQALRIMKQRQPDLVVLDMEGLDAEVLDILAFIRQQKPAIKSLLLVEGMRQQTQAQVAGVDVALIKGYPAHELVETVQALLSRVE
jgi:DNA-binding NarL/FixJ family response regulator